MKIVRSSKTYDDLIEIAEYLGNDELTTAPDSMNLMKRHSKQ